MSYKPLINGHPGLLHGGDYNPDQWLDRPETIAEDFRLMKLSGCDAFSVGIFSWSSYEPEEGRFEFGWLDGIMDRMAENGFRVNLATPSAAAPLWMALKYPEIKRVDANGERFPNGPYDHRHNQCWTSPVYGRRSRRSTANWRSATPSTRRSAHGMSPTSTAAPATAGFA
jgi:beta-galactosidase